MTLKRTITIEVEMFSNTSEAALYTHIDSFIDEIKSYSENMRFNSWHKSIPTSWDESEPVDIEVTITEELKK
jgi:hypothetical protein